MINVNPTTKEKKIAIKNEILNDKPHTEDQEYHKTMIALSSDIEEANKYIETEMGYNTYESKIFILSSLFPEVIIVDRINAPGTEKEDSIAMDYWALLNTILNNP